MSEQPPSPGEWAAIITASGAAAGAGFAGITKLIREISAWAQRRRLTREQKLQNWQDELTSREHAFEERQTTHYRAVEQKLANLLERDEQRAAQISAVRLAFELVAGALRARDPTNPALRQAEQLMTAAFPLDPTIPPKMSKQLGDIDRMDTE